MDVIWNDLYLQHHINTIIIVYRGGLIKVYDPISACQYLVISLYVSPQKLDIPFILICIQYYTSRSRFIIYTKSFGIPYTCIEYRYQRCICMSNTCTVNICISMCRTTINYITWYFRYIDVGERSRVINANISMKELHPFNNKLLMVSSSKLDDILLDLMGSKL